MTDLFTIEPSPRPALELALERLEEADKAFQASGGEHAYIQGQLGSEIDNLYAHLIGAGENVKRLEREELEKRKV
jgi:hypothetical protein